MCALCGISAERSVILEANCRDCSADPSATLHSPSDPTEGQVPSGCGRADTVLDVCGGKCSN